MDAPRTVADWIARLGLVPHPEGGWYRETYRSAESSADLPARFGGPRTLSTAIYFLLAGDVVSRLHRIKSDEVWHFYAGDPLLLSVIAPDGALTVHRLGRADDRNALPQAVVPAGAWYGAQLAPGGAWALTGGTVAPGFEFGDFELGERRTLLAQFPQHRALIEALTP
ncbi:MAG TPA: cupin domain-containing protein [Methylomirabilota bacterium]|nr:cupin domain-containing protein [Methylomirabilota bacterium]